MSERLTESEAETLSKAVNEGLNRESRIGRDAVIFRAVERIPTDRLAARGAGDGLAGTGPCARCGKTDSTTEPPNTLPVCQECAYQLGREVLVERVKSLADEWEASANDALWQATRVGGEGAEHWQNVAENFGYFVAGLRTALLDPDAQGADAGVRGE